MWFINHFREPFRFFSGCLLLSVIAIALIVSDSYPNDLNERQTTLLGWSVIAFLANLLSILTLFIFRRKE